MTIELNPASLAIRMAVLLISVGTTALIPGAGGAVYGFVAVGTVLAVVAPNRAGALVVLVADVLGWAAAYGWHGSPPAVRTAVFAIALYLLHAVVALAASVPLAAYVQPALVRQWAWNCLPGVAAAVVAAPAVSAIGRPSGSLGLDVAGLAAALVAVGALVWLATSRR